jgi:hypothetical protein
MVTFTRAIVGTPGREKTEAFGRTGARPGGHVPGDVDGVRHQPFMRHRDRCYRANVSGRRAGRHCSLPANCASDSGANGCTWAGDYASRGVPPLSRQAGAVERI